MLRNISVLAIALAALGTPNMTFAMSATGLITALHNCHNVNLDPDKRIEDCTEVIHSNMLSGSVLTAIYNNRGVAYNAKGDSEHALQNYDKALELKADYSEAIVNRDTLLDRKHNLTDAIADYDRAAKLRPDDPVPVTRACVDRSILGQGLDAALASCNAALGLQPKDTGINASRGLVFLRLGRCSEAVADYNIAIAARDSMWTAWYGRGVCKGQMGDAAGGKADIARAEAINPAAAATFSVIMPATTQ